LAIWEYENIEQYQSIEEKIRMSDLHREAKKKRVEIGGLFIESHQDFLSSTAGEGSY
jgi:hypothetical protein